MSEAVNNPYKQEAPDKTLSIEGMAADAKAVGDALSAKPNELILKSEPFSGTTDYYAQISVNAPSDAIAILGIASIDTMFIPMSLALKGTSFRCVHRLSGLEMKFASETAVSGNLWYLAYAKQN